MNAATTDVFQQVEGLEVRGRRWKKRGKVMVVAAVIVGILAGLAVAIAVLTGPSMSPNVDIPASLLQQFSNTVGNGEGAGPIRGLPFESVTDKLTGIVAGPGIFAFGVIGIVLAGGVLIFGGEISGFSRSILMMVATVGMLFVSTNIVRTMFTDEGEAAGPTPREQFVKAVESGSFDRVHAKLVEAGGENAGKMLPAVYLLSQVALKDLKDDKAGARTELFKSAAHVVSLPPSALGFTPRGDVAYAIEKVAYGSPKSAPGTAYFTKASRSEALWTVAATVASVVTAILAAAAAGMLGLAVSISGRVKRILGMMKEAQP